MDILQDYTKQYMVVYRTPKWRRILKAKEQHKLSVLRTKIFASDIFTLSAALLSYLSSACGFNNMDPLVYNTVRDADNEFLINIASDGYSFNVDESAVSYNSKQNTFKIFFGGSNSSGLSFTVYRNTNVPRILEKQWASLQVSMKDYIIHVIDSIIEKEFL